jgi:hypothetical protein
VHFFQTFTVMSALANSAADIAMARWSAEPTAAAQH